ncbi:hypothetical protein CRUP_020925, partial [Coryphaenoides rupestris]
VKFMKSVPGTSLVEMGDEYAVDRAITHLNSIRVFTKRLNRQKRLKRRAQFILEGWSPLTMATELEAWLEYEEDEDDWGSG